MRKEFEGIPKHTNARGYHVPDHTYKDPNNRKVKVIAIGAGFAGILIAYKFKNESTNVDLVVYDKNGDIGGTWLENRYPNCACDGMHSPDTANFVRSFAEETLKFLVTLTPTALL